MPRPRRPRLLLVGLPVFAVFAAFGAIVWLAYQHGAEVPPVGEPPLIKAPATALKLPPDEAGDSTVADQGEVRDLLTDTPPSGQLERLLPSPEAPLTPDVAAQTPAPNDTAGDTLAPAPTPPAPTATAAADQTPPAPVSPPAAQVTPPAKTASPPAQATASTAPAPSPAQVAPQPAQAAPTPQVAAKPAEPPRPAPVAAERQSAGVTPPATAVPPSTKEAEAALDALLAEVTQSANPPPSEANSASPSSSPPVPPRPAVASPAAPTTSTAAANPAPRPAQPAPRTPPATTSPFTQPGGQVTAIAPDRPGSPPSGAGAVSNPTIEPAPNGRVAALDGAYRIQLAAVRDEADARRAWDLFLVDLGPVLKGVQPFIERAATANGVFYRVQVGPFASLQQAELLCDQLKQRNASCFVIRR